MGSVIMAPAQEILARNTFLISIFFLPFALGDVFRDSVDHVSRSRTKKIRYLGVTPPISEAGPTPVEVAVTNALIEALKERGMFESEEESQRREIVLGKLDKMVKDFVYKVSIKKLPEPIAREAGGKIFTFGSYRLGVHASGADIDTLCVVPRHVKREDFFTVLFESLKARPEVTDLTAVPDAYVPVMKMSFSDIPIDLVFAQLQLISVADDLSLADDNLLRDLDERCIRSLNGSRMTDEILRLVPNTLAFRISLRCIKLWAKRRAIYSNVMGFLGGVAWAMLVARVCQLYPNAAAGNIVSKFFRIMFQWNWPQPVMLKSIDEGPLQVRVWNPKLYPADKAHRMPIITPAYPSMCATHNVTSSTQKIMTAEFSRAADITDKVMVGVGSWSDLFAKHSFFQRYRYYLQIIAASESADMQLRWSGMVESRIRQLIMKLELVENLELAHPFINGFDKPYKCMTPEEEFDVIYGVSKEKPPAEQEQQKQPQQEQQQQQQGTDASSVSAGKMIYTTRFYIGLYVKPREPGSNQQRKLDISWPTQEFTNMIQNWDRYDPDTMHITLKCINPHELPPFVFDAGERQREKRVLKRPRSSQVATSGVGGASFGNKGAGKNAIATDQPNKKRNVVASVLKSSTIASVSSSSSRLGLASPIMPMRAPAITAPTITPWPEMSTVAKTVSAPSAAAPSVPAATATAAAMKALDSTAAAAGVAVPSVAVRAGIMTTGVRRQ